MPSTTSRSASPTLDRSTHFYANVLGFLPVLDFGYGRLCLHKRTGFTFALLRHPNAGGAPFSELTTGIDHIGLAATDRAELEDWETRLYAAGATYTPIRDMPLGHHLNFRDPDNLPPRASRAQRRLRRCVGRASLPRRADEEVLDLAVQLVGADVVIGRSS